MALILVEIKCVNYPNQMLFLTFYLAKFLVIIFFKSLLVYFCCVVKCLCCGGGGSPWGEKLHGCAQDASAVRGRSCVSQWWTLIQQPEETVNMADTEWSWQGGVNNVSGVAAREITCTRRMWEWEVRASGWTSYNTAGIFRQDFFLIW